MLWRVVQFSVARVGHKNNWRQPSTEVTMHQPKNCKWQNAFVRTHWKRYNRDWHKLSNGQTFVMTLHLNLKISLLAAVPHKSRIYWAILNLSFQLWVGKI